MSFLASFAFLLLFFSSKVLFFFISFLLTFGFLVSIIYDISSFYCFLHIIQRASLWGQFSVMFFTIFYVYYAGDKCSQRIIINSMFGQCKWGGEKGFYLARNRKFDTLLACLRNRHVYKLSGLSGKFWSAFKMTILLFSISSLKVTFM